MSEFNFEDNTQEIFDKVISLSPGPFRKIARNNLTKSLLAKVGEGGTVTEEILMQSVREITPKPFLKMGLKQLEPLLKKHNS